MTKKIATPKPSKKVITTTTSQPSLVDHCKSQHSQTTQQTTQSKQQQVYNDHHKNNDKYIPTNAEEIANIITHLLPIIFFTIFSIHLFKKVVQSWHEYISGLIYCFSIIILFSISVFYHLVCFLFGKWHKFTFYFRIADYATIYLFIAASYTPWLMLLDFKDYSLIGQITMSITVWSIAIIGLIKEFSNGKYFTKIHSTTLFLAMGWLTIIFSPFFLFLTVPIQAVYFLILGGLFFSSGVYFLISDGKIPFAHALWHLFASAGVLCHFVCVFYFLMRIDDYYGNPLVYESKTFWEQVLDLLDWLGWLGWLGLFGFGKK